MTTNGKVQLEVVGPFGTIQINNSLDYVCSDSGFLTIEAGDDGTPLGIEHEYVFKEWYYIRIVGR
jgi:hypothetical protein